MRGSYQHVLGANTNRLEEGLGVLEEIARFVLEDKRLTKSLKEMRHQLRELGLPLNLAHRDSASDFGKDPNAKQEVARKDWIDIARAATRRSEEALRVIEEVVNVVDASKAHVCQKLRFQTYEIEKRITNQLSSFCRAELPDKLLYLVLSLDHCEASPVEIAEKALRGGAAYLQLRAKTQSDKEIFEVGEILRDLCHKFNATFIVNDRLDIALALEADGVHIGQDDFPVEKARKIIGPDMILGVSTHSLAELDRVDFSIVDYAGIGPVFSTKTKENPDPVVGIEMLDRIKCSDLPIVAIGGIKLSNLHEIVAKGCRRVAVVTGITQAKNIEATSRNFFEIINQEEQK